MNIIIQGRHKTTAQTHKSSAQAYVKINIVLTLWAVELVAASRNRIYPAASMYAFYL